MCAAKIMHPMLFDLRDPGTVSYLRKFREECHLLSLARHPNVVQYLATYYDPDTRLPVLLMELCDESLTAFLERSPGPLSYHIQLNICHNIVLGLVYLHSNGLIHRELTGNNVLMIAGTRAKITDFGMSKLSTVNPRMTALTLCPGNVLSTGNACNFLWKGRDCSPLFCIDVHHFYCVKGIKSMPSSCH